MALTRYSHLIKSGKPNADRLAADLRICTGQSPNEALDIDPILALSRFRVEYHVLPQYQPKLLIRTFNDSFRLILNKNLQADPELEYSQADWVRRYGNHIVAREVGLSFLYDRQSSQIPLGKPQDSGVEQFCDDFAEELLLPKAVIEVSELRDDQLIDKFDVLGSILRSQRQKIKNSTSQ